MSNLTVFNFVSLNGFFQDVDGDTSWAHEASDSEFANENSQRNSTLVFGRVTYEMMASFWPTKTAHETMPKVAAGMNESEKLVFTKSPRKYPWNNTTVSTRDLVTEITARKKGKRDLTVLGSGSIVTQLADAGLIDSYDIMVHPIALAGGSPLLSGLHKTLRLKLEATRTFASGTVLLSYAPR